MITIFAGVFQTRPQDPVQLVHAKLETPQRRMNQVDMEAVSLIEDDDEKIAWVLQQYLTPHYYVGGCHGSRLVYDGAIKVFEFDFDEAPKSGRLGLYDGPDES